MATVRIEWRQGECFDATDSKGMPVDIDGNQRLGAKPSELLPIALGACAAVDVAAELTTEGRRLDQLHVEVRFTQEPGPPWRFQRFRLHYLVAGSGFDEATVAAAIRRSENERCSVAASLRGCVPIESSFELLPPR
jgi:putative redox protein